MFRKIHAERYHQWLRTRWQQQAEASRKKREETNATKAAKKRKGNGAPPQAER